MASLRHALLSLVVAVTLLAGFGQVCAVDACPWDNNGSQASAAHDGCGHPAPVSHFVQSCAVCAVLPSAQPISAKLPRPSTPVARDLVLISGIDPALDPPPPRFA